MSLSSCWGEFLDTERTLYPVVLIRAITSVRVRFSISCSFYGSLKLCASDLPFRIQFLIFIIVGELRLCDLQDFQILLLEDSLLERVKGLPTLKKDSLADSFMLLEYICIETTTTVFTFLSWVILAGCRILRVRIQVFSESSSFVFECLFGSKAWPKFLTCTQTNLRRLLMTLCRD